MAIVVKHSGNAAPLVVAAYGGGQGKRWAEDGRQAAAYVGQEKIAAGARATQARQAELNRQQQANQAKVARKAAERQAALNRQHQAKQAKVAREAAERQAAIDRDLKKDQFDRELEVRDKQAEQERVHQEEMADKAFQRAQDRDRDLSDQRRDDLDYELSARQRSEFNKLSESYDEAAKSGLYDEEELGELKRQIFAKQAGIQPIPRMKEASPWPEGQGVGEVWESDDGKLMLSRNKDGDVKRIAETNSQPTYQDKISAWKQAMEMSMEPSKNAKGEAPNMEKAREFYKEIMGESEETDMPGVTEDQQAEPDPQANNIPAFSSLSPDKQAEGIITVAKKRGLEPSIIVEMLERKGQKVSRETLAALGL